MTELITPGSLKGRVVVPPSKSVAHRAIIAAALADGVSEIDNICSSADIEATAACAAALGARVDFENKRAVVRGIGKPSSNALLDCRESGSTMRFMMPVAAVLGADSRFCGGGKLPFRPITPYIEQFPAHGTAFDFSDAPNGAVLPCSIRGKLASGDYEITGSVSSQFVTGLLMALPLADGDSRIILTSRLESRPYVDITVEVMKAFCCTAKQTDYGYFVSGGQSYKPCSYMVEGDYSQAAFFCVANVIGCCGGNTCKIEVCGLDENSCQGDKRIVEICSRVSADGGLAPFDEDCSDIPDLVPILAVLASFCDGVSHITNCGRLRIKESDRLAAISNDLNALGGNVKELDDGLEISGVKYLKGGIADGCNDHRIAMAMAVASLRCLSPLTITGAECVRKSYPDFFDVFRELGGKAEELD